MSGDGLTVAGGSSVPTGADGPIFGRCGDESNDGHFCVMQPDHGGLMHCGGDPLVWWSKETGERMMFVSADEHEARTFLARATFREWLRG